MTEQVTLSGPAETLLATLYARARDAQSPQPILGDATAASVAAQIDYDFQHLGLRPSDVLGVAMRAKQLDRWTRSFLAAHPAGTVLHLGCGLDSRAERINPGPGVTWFDVDQPEVIALRHRLLPPRPNHYSIGASVTDPGWLAEVPSDRPALVVAEGLTMYLPAAEGPPLLRRLVGHFGVGGEMIFDSYGALGVRLSRLVPVVRRTGVRLDWAIDDGQALADEVPGLELVESLGAFEAAEPDDLAHASRRFRLELAVLGGLPGLRDIGHLLRYRFG